MTEAQHSDTKRLESLWSGNFGNEYNVRNHKAADGRGEFWHMIAKEVKFKSVLEVGCNIGGNLGWLAEIVSPTQVYAVDINETAVQEVRRTLPLVNVATASAKALPFRDGLVELAFTTGVLIHQSPESLPLVMSEIVRCSKKYVLCGEYFSPQLTEVPYRGNAGALWKLDFGQMYESLFPNLSLIKKGFLPKSEGVWDDLTYWLWEKK